MFYSTQRVFEHTKGLYPLQARFSSKKSTEINVVKSLKVFLMSPEKQAKDLLEGRKGNKSSLVYSSAN